LKAHTSMGDRMRAWNGERARPSGKRGRAILMSSLAVDAGVSMR
jgi:hypothetical protein